MKVTGKERNQQRRKTSQEKILRFYSTTEKTAGAQGEQGTKNGLKREEKEDRRSLLWEQERALGGKVALRSGPGDLHPVGQVHTLTRTWTHRDVDTQTHGYTETRTRIWTHEHTEIYRHRHTDIHRDMDTQTGTWTHPHTRTHTLSQVP